MKKNIFLFVFIISALSFAGEPPADKARGIFLSFGVGPRLPLGYFAESTDLGYGLNMEIDYTDNDYLPVFLFAKIGYEQYPGSQNFYEGSQYSNYSTTSIPINAGARYYFAPMLENVVLFIPFLEVSAAFNYYSKLHQFKTGSGKSNFTEDISKIGASAGAGISMFIMEIAVSYNYFQTNQFVSADLKIRLPLYISY